MNQKTEIIVPKDIKRHTNALVTKKLTKALLLIGFTVFVLVWYAREFWDKTGYWTILIYAGVTAAVWALSGIGKILADESWVGVIESVKVTTTIAIRGNAGRWSGGASRYYKNTIHVKVKREDGKIVHCIPFEGNADDAKDGAAMSFYLKNYRPGVEIVHIRGAKYYQIDPDNDPDTMNCVICGYDNDKGVEICETCGHTLRVIKKDENRWYYE